MLHNTINTILPKNILAPSFQTNGLDTYTLYTLIKVQLKICSYTMEDAHNS